jgi:DNA-binding MurR/RpiR family transcriptional regulator
MSAKSQATLPVSERIRRHYPDMTGALRTFADFVLAEPVQAARMSIHTAVQAVGVSVATANRFARAIGFGGYAEFRDELIKGFETALEPVNRLEQQISKTSTNLEVFQASLSEDVRNVQRTLEALNADICARAVDLVLSARRIYVLGFDNAASLGSVLANGLGQFRDDVRSVSNTEGAFGGARHLSHFDTSDLVIAIAFPRYIKDTIELARLAKLRRIPILAVTDSHQSPLAAIADTSLYAFSERQLSSVSNASALAIIEALVAAVAHSTPSSVRRAEEFTSLVLPWLEVGPSKGRTSAPVRANFASPPPRLGRSTRKSKAP